MIDPITAAAAATKAFTLVKAMVEHGKQAEDVLGQIGTWYGHASDCIYATKKKQNPSLFKQVVFAQSVEAEAVKALAARKRVEAQRREIFELVNIMYGAQGLQELREIREEIIRERQRLVYAQEEMREKILSGILILLMIGIVVGTAIFIASG